MALRIHTVFGDRFEAQVAAWPGGWISASPRALTRWTPAGPGEQVIVPQALPGPLAWLSRSGRIGWGPTVLADAEPRWSSDALSRDLLSDLGDLAARSFSLVMGAVSGSESEILVVFQRPQSRVRGAPDVADTVRQAIVGPDGAVLETLPAAVPTAVLWGDGDLAVGGPGTLQVRRRAEQWQHLELGGVAAPRSLARGPGGILVAGTAHGQILIFDDRGRRRQSWTGHDGPVTALCFSSAGLISGGVDGQIRAWDDEGGSTGELDTHRPVVGLAPVDGGQVAAVVGSSGDAVLLLDL